MPGIELVKLAIDSSNLAGLAETSQILIPIWPFSFQRGPSNNHLLLNQVVGNFFFNQCCSQLASVLNSVF